MLPIYLQKVLDSLDFNMAKTAKEIQTELVDILVFTEMRCTAHLD
jgi:hypothetical protein